MSSSPTKTSTATTNTNTNTNNNDTIPFIINLNVGGHTFSTTKATLLSTPTPNFFHGLLNSTIPTVRDNNGAYFIDRDGQYFAPLLTFLRTGEIDIPPTMSTSGILREARFFMLPPDFIAKLESEHPVFTDKTIEDYLYQKAHADVAHIARQLKDIIVNQFTNQLQTARSRDDLKFYIFRNKPDEKKIIEGFSFASGVQDNRFLRQFGAKIVYSTDAFEYLQAEGRIKSFITKYCKGLTVSITLQKVPATNSSTGMARDLPLRYEIKLTN